MPITVCFSVCSMDSVGMFFSMFTSHVSVLDSPQIEKIPSEESEEIQKSSAVLEPELVLGWEVLEAEGSVAEKQQEASGLVQTIVGVFSRG